MVSVPYISLEKEGQVYYSNNILLNLETIFNLDNKKKLMHQLSCESMESFYCISINALAHRTYASFFSPLL
jgi:hypothetical protein